MFSLTDSQQALGKFTSEEQMLYHTTEHLINLQVDF
jgi:hypothetical protein